MNIEKCFTKIFAEKDARKILVIINSIEYGCNYIKQHENN